MHQDLLQLWIDLNRPSAARFSAALKKRGIAATPEIVSRLTSIAGEKQLFAKPPVYEGHVTSERVDNVWAADIIVLRQRPAVYKGVLWPYIFVVQDVFSRYAWARLMRSTKEATQMFEDMIEERAPDEIVTDGDSAFGKAFDKVCEDNGIEHTIKRSRNDIATVDRLIFTIKRAFAEESAVSGEHNWPEILQRVIAGHNASGHPRLFGSAPEDVPRNDSLDFLLRQKNADEALRNSEEARKRAAKLVRFGAFRTMNKPGVYWGRRVFTPVWSEAVHPVDRVEGPLVYSQGRSYRTRDVLPVPPESSETRLPRASKPQDRRRAILNEYAEEVLAALPSNLKSLGHLLNKKGSTFPTALKEAGIGKRGGLRKFLEEYPELFVVDGEQVKAA